MIRERVDYFFASLDRYLRDGVSPSEALNRTVHDYNYVYFAEDGRLPINRAAALVLAQLTPDLVEAYDEIIELEQ